MKSPTRGSLRATSGRVQKQVDDLRRASGMRASGQDRQRPECEPAEFDDPANDSTAARPSVPILVGARHAEAFVAGELARIRFQLLMMGGGAR